MAGKVLVTIFRAAVDSGTYMKTEEIFQPVSYISNDAESSVRSDLVEHLPHVALIYQEAPDLFDENVINRVLEIILLYLQDKDNQVRQDAQTALRTLLERQLLDKEQIENDICSVILKLSLYEAMEFQALALTLVVKVGPYIGPQLTEKLFLDRYLQLCNDNAFFVRRVCASLIGEFCAIVTEATIYNRLLHIYTNLCLDSVWDVRKTCVDAMLSVARYVPVDLRRSLLSKLLVYHLGDQSRWVRQSAYEILGPFIATFAKQFHELVHNHDGWPKFNVISNGDDVFASIQKDLQVLSETNEQQEDGQSVEYLTFLCKYMERRKRLLTNNSDGSEETLSSSDFYKPLVKEPVQTRCKRKSSRMSSEEDCENFSQFRYYYDSPDMPLDPELVQSIVKDNSQDALNENANTVNDASDNDASHQNLIEDQEAANTENPDLSPSASTGDGAVTDGPVADDINRKIEELAIAEGLSQQLERSINKCLIDFWSKDNTENSQTEEQPAQVTDTAANVKSERLDDTVEESCPSASDLNKTFELDAKGREPELPTLYSYLPAERNQSETCDDIVPQILIDHFVIMADPLLVPVDIMDVTHHCAYTFPAVVLTLGKENWHLLRNAYRTLAGAVPWKVRSTLASSIHEIALILEHDLTVQDLVPIYNDFIKDLDEVRIGALKHLSTFLKVLEQDERTQYLNQLNNFLKADSEWNWRLREALANQLYEIVPLFHRIEVALYIAPLAVHLLQDKVAAVRQTSIKVVSRAISYLSWEDHLSTSLIREMVNCLVTQGTWVRRQTFVLVCSQLISEKVLTVEVFKTEVLPHLFKLAWDNVPNVRLAVARTLSIDVVANNPHWLDAESMHEVQIELAKMQEDRDRDVRIFAGGSGIEPFE